MHGNEYLMTDVLRVKLGFEGFVVSDWAGIDKLPGDYASDVRTAINTRVDMVMVPNNYQLFIDTLRNEVTLGHISMDRIDDAVRRILTAKFALNLFDKPFLDLADPNDRSAGLASIGSPEHRAVARQAVRESLVLLQNKGLLPLKKDVGEARTIVVAGKSGDDIGDQSGGWTISWQGSSGDITPGTAILEAVQKVVANDPYTTVVFEQRPERRIRGDRGIVVIGERPSAEGQGDDSHLGLDAEDSSAVTNVCSAMPCVVILISERPMLIQDQLAQAHAFVAAWLPATEGDGVTDVLFGDYDFTGKLAVSWPRDMNQVPINVDYPDYDPLFPYGFGLTHSPPAP